MLLDAGIGDAADITRARVTSQGFGRFVRSLVGLDPQAVSAAFSEFIAPGTATAAQIEFIGMIIEHLSRALYQRRQRKKYAAQNASSLAAPRKGDQDKLDAAICALVGLMWRTKPRTETIMIGDLETGYMIAPASSEVRSKLNLAALKSGVAIDGAFAVGS
jgi:hypothetical protein